MTKGDGEGWMVCIGIGIVADGGGWNRGERTVVSAVTRWSLGVLGTGTLSAKYSRLKSVKSRGHCV